MATILIIDDDRQICGMLETFIAKEGHHVL